MNHEITTTTTLLNKAGHLIEKGYAKKMHFVYNREYAKHFPLKLKEWNFYQFQCGNYVLQTTIGHVSYMGQMAVGLIDLETGKRWDYGTMKPLFVPELDLNPEKASFCEFKNDEAHMTFEVTENKRIIHFEGSNKSFPDMINCQNEQFSHKGIQVHLEIENDPDNEKLVIATPFSKPTQFYLNYKENYYKANGLVRFGEKEVDFSDATGLLDWGRGIWPYSHEWYWGNLTSHIDGVPFGFNIGWGFGDTSNATENIYFYNKKGYKIGELIGEWDDNDLLGVKHFHDAENKLQFTFTPFYDNTTCNEFVVVDTHCHQIFGHFSGTIETDKGTKEFKDVLAFIEHAVNRW